MAEETLKAKTSKGLFWGGAGSLIQQLLNAFFAADGEVFLVWKPFPFSS